MALTPTQRSVVSEKRALVKKFGALDEFLMSDEFKKLPPSERELLHDQHKAMGEYAYCLGKRIAAFRSVS